MVYAAAAEFESRAFRETAHSLPQIYHGSPGGYSTAKSCHGDAIQGKDGRADHCVLEAEVWDIVNAGPRHRFTAAGVLVANCIDHGGNWLRLGSLNAEREWTETSTNHRMVGERQERLREHKEAEPIVCPKCGKVRLSGRVCQCGYLATKKARVVVQIDGTLRHVEGDAYKPRRTTMKVDTAALWKREYFGAVKSGKTFRAAEAWFFQKHRYWPPRDIPFMPKDDGDRWRKVKDVPREALI